MAREFLEASIKNLDLEREFERRKKHYAASSEISDEDLSKISVLEQKRIYCTCTGEANTA